ncbi:HET-domain-containing protein [Cladorrhinum sp. PSN259]|nr:HET-domain-containing protein [Cladorrhinum sp. PSN259]
MNTNRLCERCSNISFTPLHQTPYSFRATADPAVVRQYRSLLFYFHHCCIPCIAAAGKDGKCRLCAFFMAKWHMSQTKSTEEPDRLCAALDLPGAGVWVILTQSPGAMATTVDGRRFRGRRQEENWNASFTFHYDKVKFSIDLTPLPGPFKDIYLTCPPKETDGMRREDDPAWFAITKKLARAWYDECTRPLNAGGYHAHCRASNAEEGSAFMPRRLIHVGTGSFLSPRIVDSEGYGLLAHPAPYLTLSYCWGETQRLKLVKGNLDTLKKRLPVEELSLTIQDAIKVTKALDFRWLWVDALCILQDDDDDKDTQLPLMSYIYKRSALTIAASIGADADAGLFPKARPGWWRPCPVYSEVKEDGTALPLFAVIPGNAQSLAVQRTPLDSRAWIFQEDLLATRTLKFCPEGIRWSCVTFCMSEAHPSKPEFHPSFRTDNNLRTWVHQPDWKPTWHEVLDPRRRYFEDWYAAVSHFTIRRIKFSSDRLPALAGLAGWMHSLRGSTYVQGLWKEDLEYGLLWFATKPRDDRNVNGDIELQDWMTGDEHYRVAPASGSAPFAASTTTAVTSQQSFFLDQAGLDPEQFISLSFLELSLSSIKTGIPSWSWAAADKAEIQFLYGLGSLTAQGTAMAKCFAVNCKTPQPGNPYTAASRGHIFLRGVLKRFKIRTRRVDTHLAEYQFPLVAQGAWTVELYLETAVVPLVVGFAALDNDPEETGLDHKELDVLLLRDDTRELSGRELVTPSGYLKPRSTLPLVIPYKRTGPFVTVTRAEGTMRAGMSLTATQHDGTQINIQQPGNRRYVTALLLQRANANNDRAFLRVGLCQMYHSIWEKELVNEDLRQTDVIVF